MTTITTTSCTACDRGAGTRLSRHTVSTGWITYYRCTACHGLRAEHTPRHTWVG